MRVGAGWGGDGGGAGSSRRRRRRREGGREGGREELFQSVVIQSTMDYSICDTLNLCDKSLR